MTATLNDRLAERAGIRFEKPGNEKSHFRPDIEGLRAVIITMVVAHHVKWLVFGGVDMSLALSGYLGVDIAIREIQQRMANDGRVGIDFWRFYARRARRILPLAAVVTIATAIATFIYLPAFKQKPVGWDALAAAGSVINFRLAFNATDYFTDNASTSPLQHYWSLGVEEQYWALLPVALVAVMWLIRKMRLGLWALAVVLGGLVAVSLSLSVAITADSQPWAYFGPQTRAWELALGGLTAVGARLFVRMWRPLAALMGWAGVVAIAYGSVEESHTAAIPGWVMIWSVAGVCMVIAAGCAQPKYGPALILKLPPLRFIGRASYGWYLWHWPALIIAPYAVGHPLSLWQKVFVALGALGVAIATYYLIERPIKRWRDLTKFPKRGVMFGLRFAIAAALAGLALLTLATVQAHTGARTVQYVDAAKLAQLVHSAPAVNDLPKSAESDMSTVKNGLYEECLASDAATIANPCYKGEYNSQKTVVLLGSSLAWQWLGPLDTIAKQQHFRLVIFTKGVCPPERYTIQVPGFMYAEGIKPGLYTQCDDWRADAYAKIAKLHPAMVIMSSHVEDVAASEQIRSSVVYFRGLGAKVVTIGETPRFDWDVPECLDTPSNQHNIQKCGATVASIFPQNGKQDAMQAAAVQGAGGTYVDPLPWMCTNTVCPPVVDGRMVYRDRNHVAAGYAIWLTNVLAAQLPKLD